MTPGFYFDHCDDISIRLPNETWLITPINMEGFIDVLAIYWDQAARDNGWVYLAPLDFELFQ